MIEPGRPGETGVAERGGRGGPAAVAAPFPAGYDERDWTAEEPSEPTAHADRRNARGKLAAGWRGLKSAIRGDSSFFAHGYRGTLIVITAALLGVDQRGLVPAGARRLPGPDRRAGP